MRPEFKKQLKLAAQQFGTPLFAYDWAEIEARAKALQTAFGDLPKIKSRIFYAMKANPNLGLLSRMQQKLGLGFEVCSGGELERAIRVGASSIVMHGPGKLDADYVRAKTAGATIMLDATSEIPRVQKFAPAAKIVLRVNPGLKVSTHDHLATGNASSKFGVALEDVGQTVQAAERAGLEVLGLHMHIGSAIENPNDYSEALERLAALAKIVGSRPVFDMGGGFGLQFELAPLARLAMQAAQEFSATELWLEPGRWLVATSGVLLASVLGTKNTARNFATLDAGMSELIRPMLYGAKHSVVSLAENPEMQVLDLAGPACESGDVLAHDVSLPAPMAGDVLAILETGAYGASMSSNYLTRPRPCEVLFENNAWVLLRRRETFTDIWAAEII